MASIAVLRGSQTVIPRQSPNFLQVPQALPVRRSRSKSREGRHSERRNRSRNSDRHESGDQTTMHSAATRTRRSRQRQDRSPPYKSSPPPRRDFRNAYLDPPEIKDEPRGKGILTPSPSPEPDQSLRQRLIGTWRLESYIAYPTPTSLLQRPTFPMTKAVTGMIMYTPDGYMSANMLIPGQSAFIKGGGTEAQWAEASKRCFSYAGPYYITNAGDGRGEVLRHTFQYCSLPGWIGDVQIRTWRFEEDGQVLVLGSDEPTEIRVRV